MVSAKPAGANIKRKVSTTVRIMRSTASANITYAATASSIIEKSIDIKLAWPTPLAGEKSKPTVLLNIVVTPFQTGLPNKPSTIKKIVVHHPPRKPNPLDIIGPTCASAFGMPIELVCCGGVTDEPNALSV